MDDDLVVLEHPRAIKQSVHDIDENYNDNQRLSDADDDKESDSEATACPICFEPWNSSGKHRIVSLRCGHLFGRNCIEKWLVHGGAASSKCPQCNAPAKKSDIRVLFVAKKIVAVEDDGKEERLLKQLEEERRIKKVALEREASLQQQIQLARAEIIRLKEEIAQYKLARMLNDRTAVSYSFHKQIALSNQPTEECRCLQIDDHYRTAIVSRHNALMRVSLDASGYSVLTSHSKPIKSVACGLFKDGLVASVGMDCRLKLSSLSSASELAEWGLTSPGWSVAFDSIDRNVIYVGLANRRIAVFDIRRMQTAVKEAILVDTGNPPLPVHSLFMAKIGEGEKRVLVGATMNGVFVSEAYPDIRSLTSPIIRTVALEVTGLCSGLSTVDHQIFCALFRQPEPSAPAVIAIFTLLECEETGNLTVKLLSKFKTASGCTRLFSPCMFVDGRQTAEGKKEFTIAVIDEPTSAIHLWDVESMTGNCRLRCALPCNTSRPLYSVAHCDGVIGCLSDQHLFLYRSGQVG